MKISISGTGKYGSILGRSFLKLGHQVYSGSRNPKQKAGWAAQAGPTVRVGAYRQAVQSGEVVVATPQPEA